MPSPRPRNPIAVPQARSTAPATSQAGRLSRAAREASPLGDAYAAGPGNPHPEGLQDPIIGGGRRQPERDQRDHAAQVAFGGAHGCAPRTAPSKQAAEPEQQAPHDQARPPQATD